MDDHRVAVSGMEIGHRIAAALGLTDLALQSTFRITIDIGTEDAVKVRVAYYPTAEDMAAMVKVLREYQIIPREFHEPEGERARIEYALRILEEYGLAVRRSVNRQRLGMEEP